MAPFAVKLIGATHSSMALSLDTSKPFRSISELGDLVRAILLAPSTESEPDWLEWKREADLSDRRWQAGMAKFIAGFANRNPNVAKREVGGCAYLVMGVEPGKINGVNPIDNANLHAGVSRFVRSTVRWSPQYIQHQGKEVLVITIEPPEYGDEIVAILADYHSPAGNVCRKGDVFIRSHGKTDRATQDDYDMLVQRFVVGAEQADGMSVRAETNITALSVACGPDEVELWLSRQREELLAPLRRAMFGRIRPFPETRSASEYRAKVASYLSEVAPMLPPKARADALVNRAPNLQLVLINETDHNFAAARVVVDVAGDVWAYRGSEEALPDMPIPPRGWGEFGSPKAIYPTIYPTVATMGTGIFGPYITNHGSTHIEFDEIDLRPRERMNLDPIHLVADSALAGETLKAVWTVTSKSSSGVACGEIPVQVSSEVISPLNE